MNTSPCQDRLGPAASGAILAAALALVLPAWVLADCLLPPDGTPVSIAVRSCRAIQAGSHPEVRAHARLDRPGALVGAARLRRLFTRALITDNRGLVQLSGMVRSLAGSGQDRSGARSFRGRRRPVQASRLSRTVPASLSITTSRPSSRKLA